MREDFYRAEVSIDITKSDCYPPLISVFGKALDASAL